MSFLYPLGLLGLLAIPVLILIYIIKSKYTEQVITSTYLWELSERFLKRKNPIKMITGILSLILQILAVVFISLAIAHPVFILKGRANDYCFILDGSGSMNVVENGKTRFEEGKDRIRDIIGGAADGSTYTLITTGNVTEVAVKQSEDKSSTLRQLDSVRASYVAADYTNAVREAQNIFDDNPACKIYLITDKTITGEVTNAQVITVASSRLNRAIADVKYSFSADATVTVTGTAYAYGQDAAFTVDVFVDEAATPAAYTEVTVAANTGEKFEIKCSQAEFTSLKVAIRGSDALSLDDSVILYNARNDAQYRTLIISEAPFFLDATLASLGNIQRDTVTPQEYAAGDYSGYGLYVFEKFTPSAMPDDGAVWFINPDTGVDGTSGFSRRDVEVLPAPTTLQLNTSTSSKVRKLLEGTVRGDETSIIEYVKCGLYSSFTTLMSCNGDPVVFAGSNAYGNREVVFALDLHTSDFAVTYNGRVLMYNLLAYTFPVLVDDATLFSGDSLSVNVLANCTGIRVESPSGKAEYLDVSEAVSEYELTEVGEYKITAVIGNSQQTARVFSQLPVAERIVGATEAHFIITGEPSDKKRDGRYEDLLYAFIILAVIVVADWVVYCYEQYQLR